MYFLLIWTATNTGSAITVINPRLIIVETNNIIPKELSVTIPYRPDFDYRAQAEQDFRGVSHLAMVKLCRQIGYRMIGAHRHGFNVFFLRNDEGGLFSRSKHRKRAQQPLVQMGSIESLAESEKSAVAGCVT
jgi:hypothetical protein